MGGKVGELIHILFYLFILGHGSKSCPPLPSAQRTANNRRHAVKATGGKGGGGYVEIDAASGVEENIPALQFWRLPSLVSCLS